MRIYFVSITHRSKPIIWENNIGTNTAICLYKVITDREELDPKAVNINLQNMPGVEVVNNVATITDLALFAKTHSFTKITEKPGLFKKSISLTKLAERISPRSSQEGTSSKQPPAACSSKANPKLPPRDSLLFRSLPKLNIRPISLDELLKNCRGDSLVYELDLRENNQAHLSKLSLLQVHSETSLKTTVQVIKNIDYYYLRQLQMRLIRHEIYNKLSEAMATFNVAEAIPEPVTNFLRDAIKTAMCNTRYNTIDTGYEHAFKEDNIPVPVEINYALRLQYAELMVDKLTLLVGTNAEGFKFPDKKLNEWLGQFKEHLGVKPEVMASMQELARLIVCTGLMDHLHSQIDQSCLFQTAVIDFTLLASRIKALQNDRLQTLCFALKKLRAEHQIPTDLMHNLPDRFYSMKHLIKTWCQLLLPKKIDSEPIASAIITKLVHLVKELTQSNRDSVAAKWISHNFQDSDRDFYIAIDWKHVLHDHFSQIPSPKKESESIEYVQNEMIRIVKTLLDEQLAKLQESVESPRSSAAGLSP